MQIKPGRGTLLQFIITPLKIGLHNLKVTAKSTLGQDILIKTLNVQAEGDTLSANIPVFIDLRSATSMERNITVIYWNYFYSFKKVHLLKIHFFTFRSVSPNTPCQILKELCFQGQPTP